MRVAAASVAATVAAVAAAPAGATGGPREVVATAASAAALPAGARFEAQLDAGLRMYKLRVPGGLTAHAYAARLEQAPGVFAAQPNDVLHSTGLFSTCSEVPATQDLTLPAAVKALDNPVATDPIAILDTGVDINVPELSLRVRSGFNTAANNDETSDNDGHGTEVAAAAAGNAADGLVGGVSPKSQIIPITIYNSAGSTTVDWVVKGIAEAANRGAGVINISSSAFVQDTKDAEQRVLAQAIAAAFNRGVITVGAIGNENRGDAVIPGALAHVLTVGSASIGGTKDSFANFGPWLDLVAPGSGLTLPAPPGVCLSGYGSADGTSFSAPAVAGGVALIRAAHPSITTSQAFDLARRLSSTPFAVGDTGRDDTTGFGMLDVAAGSAATATASEPREIDDDVFWLKRDPKTHPTYLRSGRRVTVTGALAPGKDPQDVVPISLKKGETVTATARTRTTNAIIEVTGWSPSTGSFDIGRGSAHGFLNDSGGFSPNPRTTFRAKKTGTFYIAVAAPDLAASNDQQVSKVLIAPRLAYTLAISKTKAAPVKKRTTKKKR